MTPCLRICTSHPTNSLACCSVQHPFSRPLFGKTSLLHLSVYGFGGYPSPIYRGGNESQNKVNSRSEAGSLKVLEPPGLRSIRLGPWEPVSQRIGIFTGTERMNYDPAAASIDFAPKRKCILRFGTYSEKVTADR